MPISFVIHLHLIITKISEPKQFIMKQILKLTALALFVNILFIACDDNDNNSTPSNYLKIGNTTYELSSGTLENYGKDSMYYDGFNLDLTLASKGINLTQDSEGLIEATGAGQIIAFEMFTSQKQYLDTRDYTYDKKTTPSPIGSFDFGLYIENWTPDLDDEKGEKYIVSGTVTVTNNVPNYEITIDCNDISGKKITGYYKGTLIYTDYESFRKKLKMKPLLNH